MRAIRCIQLERGKVDGRGGASYHAPLSGRGSNASLPRKKKEKEDVGRNWEEKGFRHFQDAFVMEEEESRGEKRVFLPISEEFLNRQLGGEQ